MSTSEELSFTVKLHDKDFMLYTGTPSHRLSDEIVEKITKCKGEYSPSHKGFVIPHGELCNLLDECFDYFTEESLLDIAALVESSTADHTTKERVREKSVSKSKMPKKKKEVVKLEAIKEEDKSSKNKSEEKVAERDDKSGRTKKEEVKSLKVRELEEKLISLDRQREDERRRELERAFDTRKASPVRFRAPEPLFQTRNKKAVDFDFLREDSRREDSRREDSRRGIMTMMSQLRTSMKEMNANMARLEDMLSRKF